MATTLRGTLDDWRLTRSGYQIVKIDGVQYKSLFDLADRALRGLPNGSTVEFEAPRGSSPGDPYPNLEYVKILRVL